MADLQTEVWEFEDTIRTKPLHQAQDSGGGPTLQCDSGSGFWAVLTVHTTLIGLPEPHSVCIQKEWGPRVGDLWQGLQAQSCLYQSSELSSGRPKTFLGNGIYSLLCCSITEISNWTTLGGSICTFKNPGTSPHRGMICIQHSHLHHLVFRFFNNCPYTVTGETTAEALFFNQCLCTKIPTFKLTAPCLPHLTGGNLETAGALQRLAVENLLAKLLHLISHYLTNWCNILLWCEYWLLINWPISNSYIPPWGVVVLHICVGRSLTQMCKTTPQGGI